MSSQETLTQEKAVQVLIQGVMVAQKRGAFQLEEAEMLSKAVKCFVKKDSQVTEDKTVVDEPKVTTI